MMLMLLLLLLSRTDTYPVIIIQTINKYYRHIYIHINITYIYNYL